MRECGGGTEVISPGARQTDEVDKLAEYERAGMGEYWLPDPEARTVRVYVVRGGRYDQPEQFASGQRAASVVIEGFAAAVEDVCERLRVGFWICTGKQRPDERRWRDKPAVR